MAGGEGSVFGKFFLLKRIASGGMGEIYLAKLKGPVGFEKLLVIKRILQHHLENQEFVDMFFAEARVAAQLTHSNIVQIYEMGQIEDCYYIGMEYVHGRSMREVIDRARAVGRQIHPAHVIEMIGRLCQGLSYAHNASNMQGVAIGVIHRDINPHNVLISYSGEVKIIDFGIAKSQLAQHKTETGTIKGKFVYMSPEQSAAEPLDKRSDLFSVGICTYEALTFINPFAKANVVLSLDAIQRHDPPLLATHNPKLAPLDPVVSRALAKNRDQRFPDCTDFYQALQALRDTGMLETPPESLADFMHDLFEEQIAAEKRMILETDSASTAQMQLMQKGMAAEHQSGAHQFDRQRSQGGPRGTGGQPDLPASEPRSSAPFLMLLASVLVVTVVTAAVVFTLVQRNRVAQAQTLLASNHAATVTPRVTNPPPTNVPTPTVEPGTDNPTVTPTKDRPPTDDHGGTKKKAGEPAGKRVKPGSSKHGSTQTAVAPNPTPTPTPTPTSTPATGFGSLQISTNPPVQILRGGSPVGQTFKLGASSGKLQFGTGKDPKTDPFVVKVRWEVVDNEITYSVDSEPWAIVRGAGGIGLGRTPLNAVSGTPSAVFELVNPKEQLQLRITLRHIR